MNFYHHPQPPPPPPPTTTTTTTTTTTCKICKIFGAVMILTCKKKQKWHWVITAFIANVFIMISLFIASVSRSIIIVKSSSDTWWFGTPLKPADSVPVNVPLIEHLVFLSTACIMIYLAIFIDIAGGAHEVHGLVGQHLVVHGGQVWAE